MQAAAHRNREPWPTLEGLRELQHLVGHEGRFQAAFVCGGASLPHQAQIGIRFLRLGTRDFIARELIERFGNNRENLYAAAEMLNHEA